MYLDLKYKEYMVKSQKVLGKINNDGNYQKEDN